MHLGRYFEPVAPINAALKVKSLPATEPDKWHSVGYDKTRRIQNLLEGRFVLSLCDAVHASHRNKVTCVSPGDPELHFRDHLGNLDRIHSNAEYRENGVGLILPLRCRLMFKNLLTHFSCSTDLLCFSNGSLFQN